MSGVSISEGSGGNTIDLAMIAAGGDAFAKRLAEFAEAAALAAAAKETVAKAEIEAAALLKDATTIRGDAEKLRYANKAEAERLAASIEAADKLQIVLQQKLDRIEAICAV